MDIASLNPSLTGFVHSVAAAFDLAGVVGILELSGSANRLWQFTTRKGVFVVKELPYNNRNHDAELCQAAAFEATVIGAGLVPGPPPVPNQSGGYLSVLTGSRGEECPVRLHPWFRGAPPRVDDPAILRQAGHTLRTIQLAGASWSVQPKGSLQLWTTDPASVLEHFFASGHFEDASHLALRSTVAAALELVRAGESIPGDWVYTHRDHKPENCLVQDGMVAVLDWDECAYCHPRLKAVESALRWAGIDNPNPEHFVAFLAGYNGPDATLDTLREEDFAKWVAELLSWFCFQARRAFGEWPAVTVAERSVAADIARDALVTLQSSLTMLAQWTRWL